MPLPPDFEEKVLYVIVAADLPEGARLLSNLVHYKPEDVEIGLPVKVVFEDVNEETALPKFRPSRGLCPFSHFVQSGNKTTFCVMTGKM